MFKSSFFPPNINIKDSLIWAFSNNGEYTVKYGHWVLQQPKSAFHEHSPTIQALNVLKTRIWKIKTMPKIKNFMWCTLSRSVAVADCLMSRGMHVDPICKLCDAGNETINKK